GCESCRRVMMELNSLYPLPGTDLVLIVRANKLQAQLYLAQYHEMNVDSLDFLVVCDKDNTLTEQYEVRSVPHALIVNQKGHICAKGNIATRPEVNVLLNRADAFWQQGVLNENVTAAQTIQPKLVSDPDSVPV